MFQRSVFHNFSIFPEFLITLAAKNLIPNNIVKEDHSVVEYIGFSSALNLGLQCKGRSLERADKGLWALELGRGSSPRERSTSFLHQVLGGKQSPRTPPKVAIGKLCHC